MRTFLEAVASVLEVGSIGMDDAFRETDGWSSLKGFGLLVLLENDWNAPTTIGRFLEMKTVRDLCREAFLAFAAGVLKVDRARLTGETAYGTIPEWDSVAHLRLVMETEKRFGSYYPLETIPALGKLEDFLV